MPLYILLLSFWPDGDNARRAAIREREVHMRLLSQKLTEAEQQDQATTSAAEFAGDPVMDDSTSTRDTSWVTEPSDGTSMPPVIPKGLGPRAQRYWARVLERGETIDWDEERAAQAELLGRAGGAQPAEEEQMGFF